VIYAPAGAADESLENAMARLSERLARFAGARAVRTAISRP